MAWLGVAGGATLAAPLDYAFWEEESREECSIQATLAGPEVWPAAAVAELAFHFQDGKNYLVVRFTREEVGFVRVREGKEVRWGDRTHWRPPVGGRMTFTLQCRPWTIALIGNGRVLVRAYETKFTGGRIGTGVSHSALRWEEVKVQPAEPAYFADDFTRSAGQTGEWETLAGTFDLKIPQSPQPNVDQSANPFSYQVQTSEQTLAAAGHWMYNNYVLAASVRPPRTTGAVGVAVYLQDASNYLLFRLDRYQDGPAERQLIEVHEGRPQVLARGPGGYAPEQWVRLALQTQDGLLTAFLDEEPVLQARTEAFGQGRFGLFAEGCPGAQFDDVLVEPASGFVEDFRRPSLGKWRDVGGVWQTQQRDGGAFRCKKDAGVSFSLTGPATWQDYSFQARVTPDRTAQVGLCFGYRDAHNYYLLRPAAAHREPSLTASRGSEAARVWQLLRVLEGQPTVLAATEASLHPKKSYQLKIEARRWHIRACIDGQAILEAVDGHLGQGAVGLYGEGEEGARFSDVEVQFPRIRGPWPKIIPQFTREGTMREWAHPDSMWKGDPHGFFWHVGEFFGATGMEVVLPKPPGSGVALRLVLCGDGQTLDSGYTLRAKPTADGNQVTVKLQRAGREVAQGQGPLQEESKLRFYQEGPFLMAELDDQLLAWFREAEPRPGQRIGLQSEWPGFDLGQVRPFSDHLLDDTFTDAPVHWWAGQGIWEVASRWPCSPGWSWFCGLQREEPSSPTLWSKEAFFGDQVVELFAALQMDLPGGPGYSHPSDINLTICGNGRDPSSGYSLIFAGHNNTTSLLFRKDQIVAENPTFHFINPTSGNNDFHRHWFHLRMEKTGGHLRALIDGKVAFEYNDPDPLPGGQVALWTWNNGLMVARVRVWYQQSSGLQPFPALLPVADEEGGKGWGIESGPPVTLTCTFEKGMAGWTNRDRPEGAVLSRDDSTAVEGRFSLRFQNPVSGGDLSAWVGLNPFSPAKFPRLAFAYRIGPEVKVNLYARIRGRWVAWLFTAEEGGPRVPVMGKVEKVLADGQWHEAEVPLLETLRQQGLQDPEIFIEELSIASPRLAYLRSGFGGNPWGSTFHLDRFRLLGTEDTTVADAEALISP